MVLAKQFGKPEVIMAKPDTVVNTPNPGLISTTTTEDGHETTISGPEKGSGSRTQITLKYGDTNFEAISLLQKDSKTGKEKGKVNLYSQESILELKRFLNEVTTLDLEKLGKGKLVYGNLTPGSEMLDNISSWYDTDPNNCRDLLLKLITSKGEITGGDLQNLMDRKKQVELFRGIVNGDESIISMLRTKYGIQQKEKVIECFLKENSWILGLSLDSVQYNSIDETLKALMKVTEQSPERTEHNFDVITETSVINVVELKLPEKNIFNKGLDGHGNPKWSPDIFEYVTQIQNYKRVLEEIGDSHQSNGKSIISPTAYLIVGRLSDMNENQRKVFDMYRKNLTEPKIYTYDELLERAEKIVNSTGEILVEEQEEELPF